MDDETKKILEDHEARIGALEDLVQSVTRAFVAAPQSKSQTQLPKTELTPIQKELLEHQGWKAKKKPEGGYEAGSLSYGWDFIYEQDKRTRRFSEAAVKAIVDAGAYAVNGHVFTVGLNGSVIQVKRAK